MGTYRNLLVVVYPENITHLDFHPPLLFLSAEMKSVQIEQSHRKSSVLLQFSPQCTILISQNNTCSTTYLSDVPPLSLRTFAFLLFTLSSLLCRFCKMRFQMKLDYQGAKKVSLVYSWPFGQAVASMYRY